MKRHQVSAAVTLAKPARHGANDFLLLVSIHTAVTAQNPYNTSIVVAFSQPLAINLGIAHREDRFAVLHLVMPVASPSRKKTNVEPALVRLAHDVVDVIPVIICRLFFH